ncbi:MAG: putative toxin-antitoxin system toxin component, PIN family [Rhodoferax sp.]
MRLVLDTNIVASGLFWGGHPATLLNAAQLGEIDIFTSRALLAELASILPRRKFAKVIAASGLSIEELVLGYAELATVVDPVQIAPTIAADADDDQVLACALAAQADVIVSGDQHLHTLGGQYQGITIARPAEALHLIEVG